MLGGRLAFQGWLQCMHGQVKIVCSQDGLELCLLGLQLAGWQAVGLQMTELRLQAMGPQAMGLQLVGRRLQAMGL